MPTTKEIKSRIKSVHDTQKITNAMYLISSTKMLKAKKSLENTDPFFESLKRNVRIIFDAAKDVTSPYISNGTEKNARKGKNAYLVITADKGLAGAYNQNIIKETLSILEKDKESEFYVVGDYGRNFFTSHGYDVVRDFDFPAAAPTFYNARKILITLLARYNEGKIAKLFIVYTNFKNAMTGGTATSAELLPFDKDYFLADSFLDESIKKAPFDFLPSPEAVLTQTLRSMLTGYVYSALVESFCSEQCARMTAMDSANKNAEDLLEHLSMEFNHVRQSAITSEITEISSGARSLKKSAERRAAKEVQV